MASNSRTRMNHRDERSRPTRLLSPKITGVNAAQTHDSMDVRRIGPGGDITRKPKARGSRRRLTAGNVASDGRKTKRKTKSRPVNRRVDGLSVDIRRGLARCAPRGR